MQREIDHPAAAEERAHLAETLAIVQSERRLAEAEMQRTADELARARRFDPDALPLREMLYTHARQNLLNLELSARKPYFTRINFQEDGGAHEVYYIGKYGLIQSETLDVKVVDWRAPVANLYYSGQLGRVDYVTPEGRVTGELTLKRQLGIEDGQLQTIFDTDVAAQDAYLQSVLGRLTGERLREIVTTIQAEQNFVIRYPLSASLVVQGVAGSGKTTIALHRIAYLLYAFSEALRPEHMLILAPNPLFLNFISGVLPDLGVERVRQSTFSLLTRELLGKAMPRIAQDDWDGTPRETRECRARVAQAKGSARMEKRLEDWLNRFEERMCPMERIAFGPVEIFSAGQLKKFLLEDEKPFPLTRRIEEFKKQLSAGVKAAARSIEKWMTIECDRRVDALRLKEQDAEKLRARVRALYASRDERIEEIRAQVKPFIRDTLGRFVSLKLEDIYAAFWKDMQKNAQEEDIRLAAQWTLERMEAKKPLESEDVAPLCLIALRVMQLGRRDIRHIVVDEAQDFNQLEFILLRRLYPGATFTIVGDMMQGINAWRGLNSWNQLTQGVFEGAAVEHHLLTSYRNTIEIMDCALCVARRRPVAGQREARPVLRHGEKCVSAYFTTPARQAELIARIAGQWQAAGLKSIAVIDKSIAKLKRLIKLLPDGLNAYLLDTERVEELGGLALAASSAVKGLEFDGVILSDASQTEYADCDADARLMYVSITRALHRLACLHSGPLTPLLEQADLVEITE